MANMGGLIQNCFERYYSNLRNERTFNNHLSNRNFQKHDFSKSFNCRWRQQPALFTFSFILPEQYGLKSAIQSQQPKTSTPIVDKASRRSNY